MDEIALCSWGLRFDDVMVVLLALLCWMEMLLFDVILECRLGWEQSGDEERECVCDVLEK